MPGWKVVAVAPPTVAAPRLVNPLRLGVGRAARGSPGGGACPTVPVRADPLRLTPPATCRFPPTSTWAAPEAVMAVADVESTNSPPGRLTVALPVAFTPTPLAVRMYPASATGIVMLSVTVPALVL